MGLTPVNSAVTNHAGDSKTDDSQKRLRLLERRDWSLWCTAVAVMLLLMGGLFSFSIPAVVGREDFFLHDQLEVAVRGLFGMVLLFSIFAIRQQIKLNQLRREIATQIGMLSALETRAELLQQLAILDPLTGLYNRRFASDHLPLELARSERQRYPLTLLLIEITCLQQIHEQHGRVAGEFVVREFARSLRKAIRSSDMPVRMSDCEFLVVLPECGPNLVPQPLSRIAGLEVEFQGIKIPVTFSAGWAEHRPSEKLDELVDRADQALDLDHSTGGALQQAEEAKVLIRQAQKMEVMGRLAGGVAHDFNNLLTIIRGYSELVLSEVSGIDSLREKVQQIQRAAERAGSLTRQLLAFSRKQAIEVKQVDLNSILTEMHILLERLVGEGIKLQTEFAPDLGMVRADPGQMEQIVMNLAVNARDAMPKGGSISIRTSNFEMEEEFAAVHPGARPGSYVVLAMADTGVGMDNETKAHIFEPFFTTKEKGKGTGLGLSVVYGIVKQNHGYIWVESEPGCGTSLTIYLPRMVAVEEPVVVPEPFARPERASLPEKHGTNVLVAETVEPLRSLVCELLRAEGYNALPAQNGEDAIRISEEHATPVHLMITDVVIGGMSGLDLAQCLFVHHPEMKVLYVSGYTDYAFLYQDESTHRSAFLQTPFTPPEFSRKVRGLLQAAPVNSQAVSA
jgi:diguanylate cyclase (GGDEF)-like protein